MRTQTRIKSKVKRLMEVKISFRKNVEFDFEGEMIMSDIYWAQKCKD